MGESRGFHLSVGSGFFGIVVCLLLDLSAKRGGVKAGCRDEVQLQRARVVVHAHLAVHADVPHSHLLHPVTLQAHAVHVDVRLGGQVHADAVQRGALHPVALHPGLHVHVQDLVHIQDSVHVCPLVQQTLALRLHDAADAGSSGTRDPGDAAEEDRALPQRHCVPGHCAARGHGADRPLHEGQEGARGYPLSLR